MIKSKASALLSLVLVFLSGAVLGIFAYRLYSTPPPVAGGSPPPKERPEDVRRRIVADLTNTLKLDKDQVGKLNVILDQVHQEFDQLRDRSKPDWEALKPEMDAVNYKRNAIVEKWRPEQEAIRKRQNEKIMEMLRADQRPAYEAWRVERERQRKLREQQHKKQ